MLVVDFLRRQRCELVLDILEGQKRQGCVFQGSAAPKRQQKRQLKQDKHQEKQHKKTEAATQQKKKQHSRNSSASSRHKKAATTEKKKEQHKHFRRSKHPQQKRHQKQDKQQDKQQHKTSPKVGFGDSEVAHRGGQIQGKSTCPGFGPKCACEGRKNAARDSWTTCPPTKRI